MVLAETNGEAKRHAIRSYAGHGAGVSAQDSRNRKLWLRQQLRPELLAKKLFPNRKTPLSGKKSSLTAQNPRTDDKVQLLAKGFFPNRNAVGKEKLLAKPRRGQTVPTPSASPTASPLAVGKGSNPSPTGLPRCWRRAFFPNNLIVLLAKIALCQQHVHAVGKEFSFFFEF
jgi:hypothetical protein